jgi:hypothetical protein
MHGNNTRNLPIQLYLYLKLSKIPYFSFYLLCSFFYKIGEQEGGAGSAQRWGTGSGTMWGVVVVEETMYTHISKCKNYTC